MQQSSTTQSLHLSFWGLRKIVACSHSSSQCLLVSTVFGTVSSLHPTSFLMIFTLVILSLVTYLMGPFPTNSHIHCSCTICMSLIISCVPCMCNPSPHLMYGSTCKSSCCNCGTGQLQFRGVRCSCSRIGGPCLKPK